MPPPIESILAASDLGDGSEIIVDSAARLAARTRAELHVIHSLDFPWLPSDDVVARSGILEFVDTAQEALNSQVREAMTEGGTAASVRVAVDTAHGAILKRAEEVSADVIVMGPHRGGMMRANFLGTTADRVIRSAGIPCLILKESLPIPPRRVAIPVDYSGPSRTALRLALTWCMALDSEAPPELWAVHVALPVAQVVEPRMENVVIRPGLTREVEAVKEGIPGAGALDVQFDVLWANNPAEAIAAWVNDGDIDLVVLGTRGRGLLERALIGSVAAGLARRVPCAILLVPQPRA